ncbi:MAG: MotA/TolQ/ExbB proton channel family protein [Ruminococcaceae bacterium]|nr:MotA/TolQ/ExbB proton channel family protein [Oscillospiraceae bacterium]
MDNNNEQNGFAYTYSAKNQDEIRAIREKYEKREESKMERLRRLDRAAESRATVISLIFGIVGTLILGFGMSLMMSELSSIIGLGQTSAIIIGILSGLVGAVIAILAYPAYNYVLKRERERIAPEILKLADELLK